MTETTSSERQPEVTAVSVNATVHVQRPDGNLVIVEAGWNPALRGWSPVQVSLTEPDLCELDDWDQLGGKADPYEGMPSDVIAAVDAAMRELIEQTTPAPSQVDAVHPHPGQISL